MNYATQLTHRLVPEGLESMTEIDLTQQFDSEVWSLSDVQAIRPDLTSKQAWELLKAVHGDDDLAGRASSDIVDAYAAWYMPKKENAVVAELSNGSSHSTRSNVTPTKGCFRLSIDRS